MQGSTNKWQEIQTYEQKNNVFKMPVKPKAMYDSMLSILSSCS